MKTSIFKTRHVLVSVALFFAVMSCVHEPLLNPEGEAVPTGNGEPVNTDTVTFSINSVACTPGTVYFNTQVLPIFIANCAIGGCHDAATAKEGLVLTNYQNIMKKIKPNNLKDSENYKVLITNESEDLMPRIPGTKRGKELPADQIETIKNWILQGAPNNFCDACDTTYYSFSDRISGIFELNCATSTACHGAGSQNGVLTSYNNISAYVAANQIQRRVIVFNNMPPAAPLADCDRLLIKKWIDNGAPND